MFDILIYNFSQGKKVEQKKKKTGAKEEDTCPEKKEEKIDKRKTKKT